MRRRSICVLAVAFVGCATPHRDDNGNGSVDGGGDAETATGNCAGGTKLVYVIDQFNNRLSRFDPATRTFQDLGSLSCPTMGGATPFSMSVDRTGFAWVLYSSGELFRVSIADLGCTKTSWVTQNGLNVFGMGFSTNQPGGTDETLFIGGGLTQTQSSFTLAKVDTTTMSAMAIGSESALPEMTGNGNAELWGFIPEATTARVVQFDKTTGAIVKTFVEPTLAGTMTGYAFAHWGGDYWVFLIKNSEPSSTVYQVDGATGTIVSTTPTTGRVIVGAGVSTCAPVVIL